MKRNQAFLANCGCALLVILFNVSVGGWSVNYLLLMFTDKVIPFFWAAVIGLFVAEISVPVAVIAAILRYFGVV